MSSFGLIGPHADHEVELLLAKKKPCGMVCLARSIDGDLLEGQSNLREDISALDEAVAEGVLLKKVVVGSRYFGVSGHEFRLEGHFYAQPSKAADLRELAEIHAAFWNPDTAHPIPEQKSVGRLLGYTPEDEKIYEGQSTNCVGGAFMKATNSFRRKIRVAHLLSDNTPEIP